MANKENHEVGRFKVADDDGKEYTVIEFQEVMEKRSIDKPSQWIKTGPRWYRLSDNTPLNQVDADTFKIATNDKVLGRI